MDLRLFVVSLFAATEALVLPGASSRLVTRAQPKLHVQMVERDTITSEKTFDVEEKTSSSSALPANHEPAHWEELTKNASYDPEVAARAMWWSMVASYGEYPLLKRDIGAEHLKDKVFLDHTNEVLIFRDKRTAYVVFRGTSTFEDVKRDLSVMTVNYRPEEGKWGTSRLDAFRSMLFPWRPRMHRGFAQRFDRYIAPTMVSLAQLFPNEPDPDEPNNGHSCNRIILCGHSLGGAAAQASAFLLTRWLEKIHQKLEASESGDPQSLDVPIRGGMSRGLNLKMDKGNLTCNGQETHNMPKRGVKIEAYVFSAPRLGNWQLKMEYERKVTSSFNHVWGPDLVSFYPPWEYEMGWQLRALPVTMKPLGLRSRLELFRPKTLVETVLRLHLDVVEAFIDFFDEQRDQLGENTTMEKDIGWLDVKYGVTGLEEKGSTKKGNRDRRLALARSSPKDSPERSDGRFKYGEDVKIKINPPGIQNGHVIKRMFSLMTDVAGLVFLPVAGLFLWHASQGVMDSIGPFQADYSRFTDFQITRLFADIPRVIIGLTVPMLMIFCGEIWLSTREVQSPAD